MEERRKWIFCCLVHPISWMRTVHTYTHLPGLSTSAASGPAYFVRRRQVLILMHERAADCLFGFSVADSRRRRWAMLADARSLAFVSNALFLHQGKWNASTVAVGKPAGMLLHWFCSRGLGTFRLSSSLAPLVELKSSVSSDSCLGETAHYPSEGRAVVYVRMYAWSFFSRQRLCGYSLVQARLTSPTLLRFTSPSPPSHRVSEAVIEQ